MKMNLMQKNRTFLSTNKLLILVFAVWAISLSFRMNVYDPTVPILMDSLNFLSYAIDIHVLGGLPENYTVAKPGWSILLAGLFSIFDFSETSSYMQLQRITSIFISSITIFPLYFLCNVFVEKKYSIIGATLFAFAPRLIENSMYGATEPLFILFLIMTILFFLKNSQKSIYLSFLFAGISSIIRPEGFFLFLAISFLLIFRFKREKFKFPKYLLAMLIFIVVFLPFALHTEYVNPETSIFSRIMDSSAQYFQTSDKEIHMSADDRLFTTSKISVVTGIEYFAKYLGWVMVPMFIITAPIGFLLFLKNRTYTRISIVVIAAIISIPAFYAYSFPLSETKYMFSLFPSFVVFSILPIKLFVERFQRKNVIITVILAVIILSGIIFYYHQFDSSHDREAMLIAKHVVDTTTTINTYHPESLFIKSFDLPQNWSDLIYFHKNTERTGIEDMPHKIVRINPDEFESAESLILEYDKQFSHLIVDSMDNRPEFLKDVFENEDKYPYLIKEWDSKNDGFTYHVKIFKIDYNLFNLEIEK